MKPYIVRIYNLANCLCMCVHTNTLTIEPASTGDMLAVIHKWTPHIPIHLIAASVVTMCDEEAYGYLMCDLSIA